MALDFCVVNLSLSRFSTIMFYLNFGIPLNIFPERSILQPLRFLTSFLEWNACPRPPSPSPSRQPDTAPLTPGRLLFSLIFLDIYLRALHFPARMTTCCAHPSGRACPLSRQMETNYADSHLWIISWGGSRQHSITRLIPDFRSVKCNCS